MSFISKNRGFTLIEVIVAITISLSIVLLVSYSLKFFVNSWNKSKAIFQINQKYLFLNSLLVKEYNGLIPINYNGKPFIKGLSNFFVFITEDSGTIYNGINEIGYFFNREDEKLQICFLEINGSNNIVDYDVLKDEGKCMSIDNIDDFNFQYKIGHGFEDTEELDGKFPVYLKAEIHFKMPNGVINKDIEISSYE